ncbi:hypothetical protein BGZ65_005532 [Modicella reniformis]|uniref:Uncharacterized protein n=1 Tax=Modicella reniformis TaxID=1440133 RepID=A0A9P6JHJ1_9FUNG|nr:hypothetical protein BGZ65_005532 [Modicella reniformis]
MKTLKCNAAEAVLDDEDVADDNIEMASGNKEFEDNEIWNGESDKEDNRKRRQINENEKKHNVPNMPITK